MDTKNVLSEVCFGSTMIQKLRRISLDSNLLRTLGLEEGDDLEVALIVETGEIRLRKSKIKRMPASRRKSHGL